MRINGKNPIKSKDSLLRTLNIVQCNDPDPDARWTFAVYTRPITDFRNEASCLNTIKEVNNKFKELIKEDIDYFIRLDNK